ncbi:hypothetical protein [Bacteroides acidifaciens]|uniref:hypothetical protein n=1 Tax=Bacteroides acidifaciens TaxID=85831 RepID=UPI0026EBFEF0|nr:hypothetical protein [Bacteroides acidifaciens]
MDEKKTLNGELNISSYLLAEGNSAGSVSGFRGMSTLQTTANIATLTSNEYRDKVKKLVGENGADFDDAPVYISPSMKQFDVYNIEDTKLLQQINSKGGDAPEKVYNYFTQMGCTPSVTVGIMGNVKAEKETTEFPMFEMGGSTIKDWAAVDEGLIPIGHNDDKANYEVPTATKLCEENKRRLLLGLEPDSSAIGTSDLVYDEPYRYLTNEAMIGKSRQIVVELIKSRLHHDMETGNVVVIDTMPELPSLDSFDGDVMCEVYDDKPLLPYESTRSGKSKKFAVRGGKMVPTGQYPKFMTNPKHNKKQKRKK